MTCLIQVLTCGIMHDFIRFLYVDDLFRIRSVCKDFDFIAFIEFAVFKSKPHQHIINMLPVNLKSLIISGNGLKLDRFNYIDQLFISDEDVSSYPVKTNQIYVEKILSCNIFTTNSAHIQIHNIDINCIMTNIININSSLISLKIENDEYERFRPQMLNFDHASSLQHLRIVSSADQDDDDPQLLNLRGCINLNHLCISMYGIMDHNAFYIPNLHKLHSLSISHIPQSVLDRCINLKSLSLISNSQFHHILLPINLSLPSSLSSFYHD